MGIREISERVLAEIQQGRTRSDIYRNLTASAPADAGKIAYCIASVPENDLRQKYIKHNAALCIMLVAYSILTVLTALPLVPDEPTIFLAITTIIPLVFTYFTFKFHGGVYRLAGIWFLIDLLETVLLTGVPNGIAASKSMVLFLIVVLAFLIGRKVFPRVGILGPRKDASGNYIF